MMSDVLTLADSQGRLLAETTWDRNVVVVAGAGTGKTTILVNRTLNLLLREPNPLAITEIVALTFTNKAATEMKQRLRAQLLRLTEQADDMIAIFRARYHLSAEQVGERARMALEQLEKAQIGTLHSFAAHLLRLHPLESELDPSFQEDDGSRFKELFHSSWDRWLDDELGAAGPRHDRWRRVLAGTTLDDLQQFTAALAGDFVDLDELERQCRSLALEGALRDWVAATQGHAATLLAAQDRPKRRKAEQMLAAAVQSLALLLKYGPPGLTHLSQDERAVLEKDLGKAPAGWDELAFQKAASIIRLAQHLLTVDQSYFQEVVTLVRPFLHRVQHGFLTSGWIAFDGLLARAKTLLRDHPAVRARIKETYRAILVDEFQDTDPVQYEIILYLGERTGSHQTEWLDVDLEPGKLFIVGDPKQSIYAFRRADIEAFERVVEKIRAGGGGVYTLVTNFRSDGSVLDVVNNVFDRLFQPAEHIQPANERLAARPQRKPEVSVSGAQLRLVTPGEDDEEFDVQAATRAEAEALARWLKEELLAGTTITDRDRREGPLQPGHIALIFRKLTQAQVYLDALRRYDIAYITDGEKHFYRRQEIIDVVNLLRVIDNQHDTIALVGILRSPLGGMTDRDLLALQQREGLDYQQRDRLSAWNHPQAGIVRRLYERLAELHQLVPLRPVPDAIDLIFDRLPVLELAAASLHGEQAVANLRKIRDMAEALADRPHLTLTGFANLMMTRVSEQPDEAESALVEESLDAIRVLTIHKAKGLEFPVVILPGLHQGSKIPRKGPSIHHDWSSRCYSLQMGGRSNLGAVLVDMKVAAREEAEQRRLLYVGMTRARDLLVLSGGQTTKPGHDTVLSLLGEAIADEGDPSTTDQICIGTSRLTRVITAATVAARRRRQESLSTMAPQPALGPILIRRHARQVKWEEHRTTPRRLTPSSLAGGRPDAVSPPAITGRDADLSRLVGVCAHAVLEQWDFARPRAEICTVIAQACRRYVAQDNPQWMNNVTEDLMALFGSFLSSKPYRTLQRATVLGREVPFVMPLGKGQMMEGVIDLIYRLDDRIWIADYKTDDVVAEDVQTRADRYRSQADSYSRAVTSSLGLPSLSFQFVFLRPGVAVDI
ncbi:MAG TPA: UvrD-helicase domain-containing protein [Nitrospiraceae bacterium]|jgi:ATP-dependent helicase/nuclease subunit A|nr:UvrD-helicase domain-containing protein [Nitrospiraceae bacterium]